MAAPTLIYCGSGNRRFYEIATEAGFQYGAQLPGTIYGPIYFADQNWKKPNRGIYMRELAIHKPHMASVLDWERQEQLSDVLAWAEEAAMFVDVVMLIPKVIGGIAQLPRTIGGKIVRLGYSVPTRFGGTPLPLWEFVGWPVHLLGGSPHKQLLIARHIHIESADGNMMLRMATRHCAYYRFKSPGGRHGHWPSIFEYDGKRWDGDGPYEAFRRSCHEIMKMWKQFR